MPTFESVPVASKNEETGKTEEVGRVQVPTFDDQNPDAGLEDIARFDWSTPRTAEDGTPLNYPSYPNWKAAVIDLVNTQFGTNLRNRVRQAKSGRVSGELIQSTAMSRISFEEFQAASGDPAKMAALLERKKAEVKAEFEAKKKNGGAAQQAGQTATPQATAQAEADAQAVGQ